MLSKLLKFHLYAPARSLLQFNLIAYCIIFLGTSFDIIQLKLAGGALTWGGYIYAAATMLGSYKNNLRWNLLLPIKRWDLFFAIAISNFILLSVWALSSLLFTGVFLVFYLFDDLKEFISKVIDNYSSMSQLFNIIASKIKLFVLELTNVEVSSIITLDFTYFLFFFFAIYNLVSIIGLGKMRTINSSVIKNRHRKRSKEELKIIGAVSIGIVLMYNLVVFLHENIPLLLNGLILTGIITVFFYMSFITLVLPKESLKKYLSAGLIVGVVSTAIFYSVGRFQIRNSSPDLVLDAFMALGTAAPGRHSYQKNRYRSFIDYNIEHMSSNISFTGTPLKDRIEIFKFIEKERLGENTSEIFSHNLNFLHKAMRDDESFKKAKQDLDLKKIFEFNSYLLHDKVSKLELIKRPLEDILFVLNKSYIKHSHYVLKYFTGLSLDEITDSFVEELLESPEHAFSQIIKDNKIHKKNWGAKYILGLYYLRYIKNDKFITKLKADALFLNSVFKNRKYRDIALRHTVLEEINTNLLLFTAYSKQDKTKLKEKCSELAPRLIKGTLTDEVLINICYRQLYYNAQAIYKFNLEEQGWMALDTFKKKFSKFRNPIFDYLY